MTADEVEKSSKKVVDSLIRIFGSGDFETVLAYYPLGNEVDVTGFIEWCWERGVEVGLPKVKNTVNSVSGKMGDMCFYRIDSFAQLSKGTFNVMEPVEGVPVISLIRSKMNRAVDAEGCAKEGDRSTEVFVEEKTLVATPGVVFDREGGRMGYGKGYYDRFFNAHPGLFKVGCAHPCQLAPHIELQPHDVRLDAIATGD